ncbi:MAG: glycosyltransferase family 2 protein [Acidimicrobiales bacterium]
MPDSPASISFVLPFWNEVEGAERTLSVVLDAGRRLQEQRVVDRVEIVAVDDGSTDGTGGLLARIAAEHQEVRVCSHPVNRGLGAALRSGFVAADLDWVFYTDADLPVDPLIASQALRAAQLHDADIVSCYRLDRTGEGIRRELLSAGYNLAVRAVTGLALRDVNFAAKLVRRSVVTDNLPTCDSLFFDAELLTRAIASGATVQQIGVDYFPRTVGTSTASSLRSVLDTARDLATIGPGISLRSAGRRS